MNGNRNYPSRQPPRFCQTTQQGGSTNLLRVQRSVSDEKTVISCGDASTNLNPRGSEEETRSAVGESRNASSHFGKGDAILGGEHPDQKADRATADATLRAYFAPDAVPVTAFARALKLAKIRRFHPDDITAAEAAIEENDKDGSRLWQLVANASTLIPVAVWIWPYVQRRITTTVGAQVDLGQDSPSQILHNVISVISGPHGADDRQTAKRAENDLRLAIAWLLERRNADVTEIVAQVHRLFGSAESDWEARVRKAVSIGSKAEFQTAIFSLQLVSGQIHTLKRDRVVERSERLDLKDAIVTLREKIARDGELVRRLESERAALEQQLEKERTKAESDRRHHAHSSSQRQADIKTSLHRVKVLVVEAGEAVQIAMKRAEEGSLRGLQAADRRISSAIDAIAGINK